MDNETFFDDIYQFPTSSYLKINLNKDINLKFSKFWRLNIKHNKKFDEACKEVKRLLKMFYTLVQDQMFKIQS